MLVMQMYTISLHDCVWLHIAVHTVPYIKSLIAKTDIRQFQSFKSKSIIK